MIKNRILAIGLSAVLTLGVTAPLWANEVTDNNIEERVIATQPTMLTDEELAEFAITAPNIVLSIQNDVKLPAEWIYNSWNNYEAKFS